MALQCNNHNFRRHIHTATHSTFSRFTSSHKKHTSKPFEKLLHRDQLQKNPAPEMVPSITNKTLSAEVSREPRNPLMIFPQSPQKTVNPDKSNFHPTQDNVCPAVIRINPSYSGKARPIRTIHRAKLAVGAQRIAAYHTVVYRLHICRDS